MYRITPNKGLWGPGRDQVGQRTTRKGAGLLVDVCRPESNAGRPKPQKEKGGGEAKRRYLTEQKKGQIKRLGAILKMHIDP